MGLPALILLGVLPVTSYIPSEKQTDSTPYRTSINHRVNPFGVAVSHDLLASGQACYGDTLYIEGFGLRIVNDVMNERNRRRVDIFVETQDEEKLIQEQRRRVFVMQSPVRACSRKEAMRMGMENAKRLRKGIEAFKKQNGRQPSYDELRDSIMSGRPVSRASRDLKGQAATSNCREGSASH